MSARRRGLRVYVVGGAFALAILVLWGRLFQVQYVRHDEYAKIAIEQRVRPQQVNPVRGGVFDRAGRPLALSARLCSVALKPGEVRSRARVERVLASTLPVSKRAVRRRLTSGRGFVWVARQLELDEDAREALGSLDGVEVVREDGRVYPYGAVAAKIVGFAGYDNNGIMGVEMACDRELRGAPGLERVIRNGRYRSDRYHRFVEKAPRNGKNVYLTIDATVQQIAEAEIETAVRENDARFGSAIVMDVRTGEILALAEYPRPRTRGRSSRADSLWTIRSLSHVYEPGSTFKVVTAAALLDRGLVTREEPFDAEQGRARVGAATIRDPHPHDVVTFAEAFAYSSNVVMAKAAQLISAEEFYEFTRLFGFGMKTGIRMSGESAGWVAEVADWSGRTQTTMAFGQEVAVTPLQMLNAYAAIANDGVMMTPRLIKGVTDAEGGEVRRADPVEIRRVVSKKTARVLREFCREVVDYGTGQAAGVTFMRVAGKTGTGEKAGPGGYVHGKYVASFIGFAPYEDPRVACLVLLDEPRFSARYGGDSAAPVFARLCRSMANSTDIFDEALAVRTVKADGPSQRRVVAPNFLRMDKVAALERARHLGANVLCQGGGGRVIAQQPRPGVAMDRDDVVRLIVSDGEIARAGGEKGNGLAMRSTGTGGGSR